MLNYFDVIKAQSGIPVDDIWAQLWGDTMRTEYVITTYTGALPATLQTIEGYLESYKIYGNTVQDGTPTPENPIMPSGCGGLETAGVHAGQYKLPLTVNGVEYPIYLGESQTTRRIRKLVLTGEETFTKNYPSDSTSYLYYTNRATILPGSIAKTQVFCNELPERNSSPASNIGINANNDSQVVYFNFGADVMNTQPSGNTVVGLKEYLAAQYAAGTPVTVWYVLAEPETGIVNEPLMKIGEYADTIDSAQTTTQIPTSAGETTISWAGEGLAPSEIELTYRKQKG